VGILHHLLDENMSGHLFTLLGSNTANSTSLAQANADVASTESSASGTLYLFTLFIICRWRMIAIYYYYYLQFLCSRTVLTSVCSWWLLSSGAASV
jgi:hypothetical protein